MTESATFARWYNAFGQFANDPLFLFVEEGRAFVGTEFRGRCTMCNDWSVTLEADSLEELEKLLERDLAVGAE